MISPELEKALLKKARLEGVQKIGVAAVIINGEKALLLRRKKGDYLEGLLDLPGGGVEANETMEQALRREVFEETALTVKTIGTQIGYFDYFTQSNQKARQHSFEVTTISLDNIQLQEHDQIFWLEKNELDHHNISPNTKKTVLKALQLKENSKKMHL